MSDALNKNVPVYPAIYCEDEQGNPDSTTAMYPWCHIRAAGPNVLKDTTFCGENKFSGDVQVDGDLTVDGDLNVEGTTNVNDLNVTGNVTGNFPGSGFFPIPDLTDVTLSNPPDISNTSRYQHLWYPPTAINPTSQWTNQLFTLATVPGDVNSPFKMIDGQDVYDDLDPNLEYQNHYILLENAETGTGPVSGFYTITGLDWKGSTSEGFGFPGVQQFVLLFNSTGFDVLLSNNNSASVAENRFHLGGDVILKNDDNPMLLWRRADNEANGWTTQNQGYLNIQQTQVKCKDSGFLTLPSGKVDNFGTGVTDIETWTVLTFNTLSPPNPQSVITGLDRSVVKQCQIIGYNDGPIPFQLQSDNGVDSLPANRLSLGQPTIGIQVGEAFNLYYNETIQRWMLVSHL